MLRSDLGVNRTTIWRWAGGVSFPGAVSRQKLLRVFAIYNLESNDLYEPLSCVLSVNGESGEVK